jgi:tetratricopeptide (TPR) repeat protein
MRRQTVYFAYHQVISARSMFRFLSVLLFSLLMGTGLQAQSQGQAPSSGTLDAVSSAERGISLASKGRCREALPVLKRSASHLPDRQVKYRALMSTARCAMSLDQTESAVESLVALNHEFPHDPDVLYSTTHFYSELASRAAQELAATAPNSHQAEQLEAESFESQGNWDRAEAEYRKILEQEPKLHGIHYRLGRIFLSKSPADTDNAKAEFEAELKLDPDDAPAEFLLGEIARQGGQWDDAIAHFSRAAKLDEGFQEAYLALGMSLNAAGKFSDAVQPLQSYVKMQPADPAGHYQLATAYARTGRKQEADHETALQREAMTKKPQQAQTPQ